MDLKERFAINLRRIRKEKGFSQERLANEAEVDRAHVSKIERQIAFAGLEIMGKFGTALKVDPVEFLRPIPEKQPSRRRT